MAAYSPPMPQPVSARRTAKVKNPREKAVAAVAVRYKVSVMKNSFRRPKRSVAEPNTSAPTTAPIR